MVEKRKRWSRGWQGYNNVPFDIEVKARADFQPQEWLRQAAKRADGKELPFVVVDEWTG
jgi:hypothetical protein